MVFSSLAVSEDAATFFLADFFFAITNTPSPSRNNPSLPTPAPAFNPLGPRSSSEFVQRLAQRAGDETLPERATGCDEPDPARAQTKPPKSLPVADLSGVVRPDATHSTSSGGGTRTPDTRIMIPLL